MELGQSLIYLCFLLHTREVQPKEQKAFSIALHRKVVGFLGNALARSIAHPVSKYVHFLNTIRLFLNLFFHYFHSTVCFDIWAFIG